MKEEEKQTTQARVADAIRGSLMAGAAGDALGYPVEFMTRHYMTSIYGPKGITTFNRDRCSGKTLVSDDTQMTLFTAAGLLTGWTGAGKAGREYHLGEGVADAYLDWYYTQMLTPELAKRDKHTWLRDLPALADRRAPGSTCMGSCAAMAEGKTPHNNSSGCGGIMRVAPVGLMAAAWQASGYRSCTIEEVATAAAESARLTHKHPLGFLPAALLAVFVYKVAALSASAVKTEIDKIASETIGTLDVIYPGEFSEDKASLKALSKEAVTLAHSDRKEAEAIERLGEGWVGDEAWAIALYCTVRHIDSITESIIAAVNHDGDSDSTGAIAGNMMGAVYGYEAIQKQRIFCPEGCGIEEILELSEIILALADDLATGCGIDADKAVDTPEKQRWHKRYCEMEAEGITAEE